jgi:EmrB/QacA subfamily drug resistance transporter
MHLRPLALLSREPAPLPALARLRWYPWLVVGTTCTAAFIGQVDASIVQLGLPALAAAFGARPAAVSWVAVAYVLAFAAILPVFARLAEAAGRKLLYLIGFTLFAAASALCGLAPSLAWLIALRVLQGIGGALLGANSIVILAEAAGPARRGRAMGLFAGAQAVGIGVGPAAGGVLLAGLSWHWLFWVSVPFSLAGLALGWLAVPRTTRIAPDLPFDWRGAVLLTPALLALMTLVLEGARWAGLTAAALAAATALLLAGFVRQERRSPAPLIDPALFRARAFSGGVVAVVLSYAMLYGMFFAMSFALVRGYHDGPLAAGLRLTVVPLALGVVAPFSAALAARGPRLTMAGGMALCATACLALLVALTGTHGSLAPVLAALAVFGGGLGLFIAPNNSATLGAAPVREAGEAAGLLNLMRALGTGAGVAAASAVLTWRLGPGTTQAAPAAVLAAARAVMPMLALAAAAAAAAAQTVASSSKSASRCT